MKFLIVFEDTNKGRRFRECVGENCPFIGYIGQEKSLGEHHFNVTAPDQYTALDMFYWLGRYNLKPSSYIINEN